MTDRSKKLATILAAGVAMTNFATFLHAGEITIYSALEEEEINQFVEKAREEIPEITLNVLRLSTGNLTARLLVEAENPQADVVLSLPVTNIMNPNILNIFEPYAPKGIEQVPEQFRDPENRWFSLAGYMEVFCVNTDRIERLGLPIPTSWEELADPKYKGEVVMPDPLSSGVGFIVVASLANGLGEEKGWDLLGRMSQNMAQYTNSGSRPCRMAQTGEYSIGVSYEVPAIQAIDEGYPMQMVIPSDLAGYEISGIGLLKGSKNEGDAKAFLDWMLTKSPLDIYQSLKPVTTIPREASTEAEQKAGMPTDLSSVLAPMDFGAIASQRDAMLARWTSLIGK
ncbi:ABC transporter substrate-binding protein [Paenirhodobacter sp.]|uniref:ABC transporter substrate-binding protein n=1 Tax=Paenirhodobacter sp. TaxID=1965326 RepID=UPI003B425B5D